MGKLLLIVAAVLGVMVQGLGGKDEVSCHHPKVKDQNKLGLSCAKLRRVRWYILLDAIKHIWTLLKTSKDGL